MMPPYKLLRQLLAGTLDDKEAQGFETGGLRAELDLLPDSYDAMMAFAGKLASTPPRPNWPYVEPVAFADIMAECAPDRATGAIASLSPADAARKVAAAFTASVCGCILGKPLEINPTLHQLEALMGATGDWPLRDYVSEAVVPHVASVMGAGRTLHGSWTECVRERISYAAPDDDINYTVLGMLILEDHGINFTRQQLMHKWLRHLPVAMTFGPERTCLVKAAQWSYLWKDQPDFDTWTDILLPLTERCGALIRADAYGYACTGRPALAAELAWRDASFTHRLTGVYGTMFTAAAIAVAQVCDDRLEVFRTALKYVPQRSRFHSIASHSLENVARAADWREGYEQIHKRYGRYGHCMIYQEVGTLINTLRFARDTGDGICMQVMQGCDTDSFGATAGSILGAFFGPGHLEERWTKPFNDDIRSGLALFFDRSLSRLAERMGRLPQLVARELEDAAKAAAQPAGHTPGVADGT